MSWERWLPVIMQKRPEPIELRFVSGCVRTPVLLEELLGESLSLARLEWSGPDEPGGPWRVTLPWQTLVLGTLRLQVHEQVEVRIGNGPQGQELRMRCLPLETHNRHAAGLAGVIVLVFLAWLLAGWSSTGITTGAATVLFGGSLAVYTRNMALTLLQRRLSRLAEDLGMALWPRPQRL